MAGQTFGTDEINTVAYKPFLGFFYPTVKIRPDLKKLPGHRVRGAALNVPIRRMPEVLRLIRPPLTAFGDEFRGLQGYLVAYIGAGTLHPIYVCPSEWEYDQRVAAARRIRAAIEDVKVAVNATVSEQGIFPQHVHWFERHNGLQTLSVTTSIKQVLDPRTVLNPARIDLGDAPPRT